MANFTLSIFNFNPILFWLFILISPITKSQDYVDIARAGYYYSPNNNLKEGDGQADIEEARINLLAPKVFKNGDIFIFAANAHRLSIYKRGFGKEEPDDRLHGLMLRLGYTKQLSSNWGVTLMAISQFNGDFGEISSNDAQHGGLVMLNWKRNDRRRYQFGLFVNRHLFGTFVLPMLGFDWKIGERWFLYGTLPFALTASYKFSERLRGGLNYYGILTSYRYANRDYLEKGTNEPALFLDLYATKTLVFRVQAGISVARHFRRYGENDKVDWMLSALKFGENRTILNQEPGDGLVFGASLIFRVPRPH